MRSTLLLVGLLVGWAWLGGAEINNFDYSKHGADWEGQSPEGTDWSQCSSRTGLVT